MGKVLAHLAIAWPISLVLSGALSLLLTRLTGHMDSGLREAVMGLGVVLLLPSLLFALLIGAPFMTVLARQAPPGLLLPVLAGGGLALLMWLLTAALLPEGWTGAGVALIAYAALLGLIWGSVVLLTSARTA